MLKSSINRVDGMSPEQKAFLADRDLSLFGLKLLALAFSRHNGRRLVPSLITFQSPRLN